MTLKQNYRTKKVFRGGFLGECSPELFLPIPLTPQHILLNAWKCVVMAYLCN